MKKLLTSIVAAGVLVSGAFVASTVTGSAAEAVANDDAVTDRPLDRPARPEPGAILDEVLGGLVADGTLTEQQADAVKSALEAKCEDMKSERGDRRPGVRRERRGLLRGLLADGVITADEIAALPDDHPLKNGDGPLAELLEGDGEITRQELQAFREAHRAEREQAGAANG